MGGHSGSGTQKPVSLNCFSYHQALLSCQWYTGWALVFVSIDHREKKHRHDIRITASTREADQQSSFESHWAVAIAASISGWWVKDELCPSVGDGWRMSCPSVGDGWRMCCAHQWVMGEGWAVRAHQWMMGEGWAVPIWVTVELCL